MRKAVTTRQYTITLMPFHISGHLSCYKRAFPYKMKRNATFTAEYIQSALTKSRCPSFRQNFCQLSSLNFVFYLSQSGNWAIAYSSKEGISHVISTLKSGIYYAYHISSPKPAFQLVLASTHGFQTCQCSAVLSSLILSRFLTKENPTKLAANLASHLELDATTFQKGGLGQGEDFGLP